MDNEKELTQQETAPKPKKTTKKKTTKETATVQEPTEQNTVTAQDTAQEQQISDSTERTTSVNENDLEYHGPSTNDNQTWNFYNQVQSVETKSSHGGSNKTPSVRRNAQKRIRKAKTQRASRRINRRK